MEEVASHHPSEAHSNYRLFPRDPSFFIPYSFWPPLSDPHLLLQIRFRTERVFLLKRQPQLQIDCNVAPEKNPNFIESFEE